MKVNYIYACILVPFVHAVALLSVEVENVEV